MIIQKKSIRSSQKYLSHISENTPIIIGVKLSDISDKTILEKIGFSSSLNLGEQILPSYIGPKTKFNGEGKQVPQKCLPKETFYIFREWNWKDFTGKYYSEIIAIPRKRYPRLHIPAPGIELNIGMDLKEDKYIFIDPIIFSKDNELSILNSINIMLEIFKFCYVYTEDFKPTLIPVERLNWKTLPSGPSLWNNIEKSVLESIKVSKRVIYVDRIKKMKSYNPDFIAVGHGGFSGYIVFGYPNKNLYVLENLWYGNATYIFNENWEYLSQLTKTEILFNNLFSYRINHSPTWANQIHSLLKISD